MDNKTPARLGFAFSLTAAAMLGAVIAASLEQDAASSSVESAMSSIGAVFGPADEHEKHAHPEHYEPGRGALSGRVVITISAKGALSDASEVGPAGEHHEQHEHEPHPESNKRMKLEGLEMRAEIGDVGLATTAQTALAGSRR